MDLEWQPTNDGRGQYCFPPDSSTRLVVKENDDGSVWWGMYTITDSGEDDLDLLDEGHEDDMESAMDEAEMASDLL